MLSHAPSQAEAACSYDLDECDVMWLKVLNGERAASGLGHITEEQLERIFERLEHRCWDKIQSILRNEEGLGIEFDENVICDVCRSPDSEDGNEMVFCDSCNICVHQACYGITRIPEGQWLCCTCAISQKPECILCPNKGGAMKCTRSGKKWAHVSCALWIPEVSIGCVEKMEPITKISSIPQSRWALICVLCRERVGACIQCSVKTCKTAYHVTCAFKHGLEMRAIIEDENADDGVKLRSYCEKHSKSSKKEKGMCSGSDDEDSKRKKRKDMTSEEKNQARAARLQEIEAEFHKLVTIKDIGLHFGVDLDCLQSIYNYWKLKRKAGNNKPLLPPKTEDVDVLSNKKEQADLEKMKTFVQLRQDLERVRNLCYMVSRREKLSRSFFRMREQTFYKQTAVLEPPDCELPSYIEQAVIEANHGPSIYDQLYSHNSSNPQLDIETLLGRISGIKSPKHEFDPDKKYELNGLFKDVKNNPYKKLYFNGSSKRRSGLYDSASSSNSSDEAPKENKENRIQRNRLESEINKKNVESFSSRSVSKLLERRQRRLSRNSQNLDSSSDDCAKITKKSWGHLSKSRLKQVESELGRLSGTDSDEILSFTPRQSTSQRMKAISSIYSDSESSDASLRNDDKSSNAASDSQQSKLRTKAAVKDFSNKLLQSKSPNKSSPESKHKNKTENSIKLDDKQKDCVPSDLIVPQRQAAKKASENMKSTTRQKEQPNDQDKTTVPVDNKSKIKKNKKEIAEVKKPTKVVESPVKEKKDKGDGQEILSYVPQRQAARKAAEHIKSGLGKAPINEPTADSEKSKKESENIKGEVETENQKEKEVKRKLSSDGSRSSSSVSSSGSSSSCSSDSEKDVKKSKSSDSEREQRTKSFESHKESRISKSKGLFSPHESTERTSCEDWPFLDKAAKSPISTSSSDSNNSNHLHSFSKHIQTKQSRIPSPTKEDTRKHFFPEDVESKPTKKPMSERKESPCNRKRASRDYSQSSDSGHRIGDADVRTGAVSDSRSSTLGESRYNRKEKSNENKKLLETKHTESNIVLSPIRKSPKKISDKEVARNSKKKSLDNEKHVSNKRDINYIESFVNADCASTKKSNNYTKQLAGKDHEETMNSTNTKHLSSCNASPTYPIKSQPDILSSEKLNCTEDNYNESIINLISPEKVLDDEKLIILNESVHDEKKNLMKNVPYQNRSIFSPQPQSKDDLLDFENILEDGFGISKDDILKAPLQFSFTNEPLFKEDSKEDSVRETLNLVEKLRMEMSKKSTSSYDIDENSMTSSTKNDNDRNDLAEQIVPNTIVETPLKEEIKSDEKVNSYQPANDNCISERATDTYVEAYDLNKHLVASSESNINSETIDILQQPENKSWSLASNIEPNFKVTDLAPSDGFIDRQPYKPIDIQDHPLLNNLRHNSSVEINSNLENNSLQVQYLNSVSVEDIALSSPYADLRRGPEWAESEMMPHRRSTTSSPASVSSSCSRKNKIEEDLGKRSEAMLLNPPDLEMTYNTVAQTFSNTNAYETFPPFPETTPYIAPVSLYPTPNINTQLPFPTGATIYPPNFGSSFPSSHTALSSIPKTVDDAVHCPIACTAAFTSSEHNMALTAAMVNIPTGTPTEETKEDIEQNLIINNEEVDQTILAKNEISSTPEKTSSASTTPIPQPNLDIDATVKIPAEKKSPNKPTRSSSRFASIQSKSPSKSPNKSPRQEITNSKNVMSAKGRGDTKRSTSKVTRGSLANSRGRGRGKGRGKVSYSGESDYLIGNTIHNKLVGTVYDLDFDDGISDSMADLKAMRERRKSVDTHDKKLELPYESPSSMKYSNNSSNSKKVVNVDVLKPPSPVENIQPLVDSNSSKLESTKSFPDMMVQPVLPGPVDMRTYSKFDDTQSFNDTSNLLNVFNSGNAESRIHEEIDEDFEKELHSALKASLKKTSDNQTSEVSNIKVSLSDSRNQLKVKIKGPIANYTSNVISNQSNTVELSNVPSIGSTSVNNTISNTSIGISSGSSNLRRMRKKELLRQYWTQENMDEPTVTQGNINVPTVPPRAIITIPKAVASMTTIPTKDDYRDYRLSSDEAIDSKHKKDTKPRALSRELKQLDLILDDDTISDRRRSFDGSLSHKKRGRPPRPSQTTPKLKIKIGDNNETQCNTEAEENKDKIRPPKKRITTSLPMPSVEDYKRESMKYRKLVMAGFGEEKEKKKKKNKNDKHKKKKKRELQIISNESINPTKLVIRFGKKTENDSVSKKIISKDSSESATNVESTHDTKCDIVLVASCKDTFESDQKCLVDPSLKITNSTKITPIKLKLSRCQEGSGYVMKNSDSESLNIKSNVDSLTNHVNSPKSIPVNKDCEVR